MGIIGKKSIVVLLALTFCELAQAETAAEKNAKACIGSAGLVDNLEAAEIMKKKTPDYSRMLVFPEWYKTSFQNKENVSKLIATCLAPSGAVRYYDSRTGKEVAQHTAFSGFKMN